MSRYYCPFCSYTYQYYKTKRDALLICGHCGEDLIKVPLIKTTQFIGLIGASVFLFPLILMIIFVVKDINNQRIKNSSIQIPFLSFNLDDGKY